MIPPTQPAKKITRWKQDQGHEVVLHDQGEGYQQPKAFKSERSQVPQGVKEGGGLDLIDPLSSLY